MAWIAMFLLFGRCRRRVEIQYLRLPVEARGIQLRVAPTTVLAVTSWGAVLRAREMLRASHLRPHPQNKRGSKLPVRQKCEYKGNVEEVLA